MKYTDEQIDAFLASHNVSLLLHQRELFKTCVNYDGPIYVCMARWNGRSYFKSMVEKFKEIMGEREE